MNRLNLLLLLPLILIFSCQSESPPKEAEVPEPVQTELAFKQIKEAGNENWGSKAALDIPISGTSINFEKGNEALILDASKENAKIYVSSFKHGDIELDLEFMLTKGAEASISFQGGYSILIADSWSTKSEDKNTTGSIKGNSPTVNAGLAPGLWQHLRVLYHAPKPKELKGSVFSKVLLNGVLIHENLKLKGGTIAPRESIFFKAKKGSIAFRNISHKLYEDDLPTLEGLEYKYYKLTSKTTAADYIPDFSTMEAKDSGRTDSLSKNVTEDKKDFGLTFEGKFIAPAEGDYLFEAKVQGGAILLIDGKEVVNHDGETNYEEGSAFGSVNLSKGAHDFTYLYRKEHMQWREGLGLFVEGPGVEKMALHAEGSVYPSSKYEAYELEAESGTSLHRSYLMHKGKKLTHAISIGNTNGLHYSYDLDNASLLQMWGGKFLDVRKMWVGRGAEQLSAPMGSAIIHSGKPDIAMLNNNKEAWPDSLDEKGSISFKGYDISANGEPVFRYKVGEGELRDHISTNPASRSLHRKLSLEGNTKSGTYILLAKGKKIHQGSNGVYGVDIYNYYLNVVDASEKPFVRETSTGQELLLAISPNSSISYTLTW